MDEADRDSTAAYNYPWFDEYVAAGGDGADEDAFRASPGAGQRAPDFTLPRLGDGAGVRQAEFRYTDRKRFMQHLLRNGPRAVAEFQKAQHLWAERARDLTGPG